MAVNRALVVVWCALLAVSMATEMEVGAEVVSMEGAQEGKLYNGLPKQDLPTPVQKGISVMDQFDSENDEMVKVNKKLIKRLSAPWKTKVGEQPPGPKLH